MVLQHHRVVNLVEEVPRRVLLQHGVIRAELQRLVLVRCEVVASVCVDVGEVSRKLLIVGVLERVDSVLLAEIDEIAVELIVLSKALPIKEAARPLVELQLLLLLICLPLIVILMALLLDLSGALIQIERVRIVVVEIGEVLPPHPLPPIVLLLLKAIVPDVVLDLHVKHHLLRLKIIVLFVIPV